MVFAASEDFGSKLALGQIIKGQVLRSYEGGRYLVSFGGHEKVVDSSVPLKPGELIQGRVTGLGDKVELKRVYSGDAGSLNSQNTEVGRAAFIGNKWDGMLLDTMRQHQVRFSNSDKAVLMSLLKKSTSPELLMLTAIALVKQGIPLKSDLLKELMNLQASRNSASVTAGDEVIQLASDPMAKTESSAAAPEVFGKAIASLLGRQQSEDATEMAPVRDGVLDQNANDQGEGDSADSHDERTADLWRVLNIQVDGSVQHRFTRIPIWLSGRLVEVDIAIYEQRQQARSVDSIHHRRIVFSLDMEMLGKVDIDVLLASNSINLNVTCDNAESTRCLIDHGQYLIRDINAFGWELGRVSYTTESYDHLNQVVNSVVEHFASQDSLSRLM